MKQKIFIGIFTLALFILGSSLLPAQETQDQAGFVVAIRGRATAFDTQGATRTLAIKSPVFINDVLKTGPKGRLQILFTDNTIISIGRASEIEITQYHWNPDEKTGAMKTRVKEGVFRVMGGAITRENSQEFITETPAATIGIRGSMYAGKVSGKQLIVVFEGGKGIDVMNNAGSVAITKAGFGTRILSPDTPPQPPRRFSTDELSDIDENMGSDSDQEDSSEEETSGDEPEEEEAGEDESGGDQEQTSDKTGEESSDEASDNEETQPHDEDASTETDDSQDSGQTGDQGDTAVETTEGADESVTDSVDAGLDTDSETDPSQDSADYSQEGSSFDEGFSADTDLSQAPQTNQDPVETSFLPMTQEVTQTTTSASQEILDNTVTETLSLIHI